MADRIACFIGQMTQDYQREITEAIRTNLEELGYDMCLFSEFGSFGENYLHAEGEKNIINLPFLDQYAGIIVGLDTFDNTGMSDALVEKIEAMEKKVPIVSIRQKDDRFYNVVTDDRSAIRDIIEHFIVDHKKTKICFMTGRMEMEDAQLRLQGYRDAMEAHGLQVTDRMLFYGDYWRYMSEAAVEWFLSGEEKPEVIACANDYMAMAVCDSLRSRGIKVPEEIAVSGFDDVDEARFADLRIASVRVPTDRMGREAVRMLDKLIHGEKVDKYKYISLKKSYEGTCGCKARNRSSVLSELYKKKEYLRRSLTQSSYMNVEMEKCDTLEDVFQVAYMYSFEFPYNDLYICLNDRDELADGKEHRPEEYSEHMILKAILSKDNGVKICDEWFERKDILPLKYRNLTKSRYMFPLHFQNHCLGYVVIQINDINSMKEYFPVWTLSLASYIDRVSLYEENRGLLEFRKLSITDELTGLYNRRMLDQFVKRHLAEVNDNQINMVIISLDMDGLKPINDTFGHMVGDEALKAFADILKKEERPNNVLCARVGGDEFTICIANAEDDKHAEDVIANIQARIDAFNAEGSTVFKLSTSAGYAKYEYGEGLANCLKRADDSMYKNKHMKKNARRNEAYKQ